MAEPSEYNCDHCKQDYAATRTNADGHLFLTDPRCNHITAECPHCGGRETIYLPPSLMVPAVVNGAIRLTLYAEASQELRAHAEGVWLAAQQATAADQEAQAAVEEQAVVLLRDLDDTEEGLLAVFADSLRSIPTDMLWDGFGSEPAP